MRRSPGRVPRWWLWLLVAGAALAASPVAVSAASTSPDEARFREMAWAGNWEGLKPLGPAVLPRLVRLYGTSSETQRARIALVFYSLGWKSDEARRVLMKDVHTPNEDLRLQVQWALGRVSDDPEVVDVLLANLQNDANPLFRDKAACALAYDQIHLTPEQKVRLLAGLIVALDDPKIDVRNAAILALRIHTGQTRGFNPSGPPEARRLAVEEWLRWLAEYKAQL
jgi:HEAT repeat protein